MNYSDFAIDENIEKSMSLLNQAIDPETGEVLDENILKRATMELRTIDMDKETKVLEMGSYILYLKTQKEAALKQERIATARKKSINNRIDWAMQTIRAMFPEDKKKLSDERVEIRRTIEKKLFIYDEKELSSNFTKFKYQDNPIVPDKQKLEKALKALQEGEEIPGVSIVDEEKFVVT